MPAKEKKKGQEDWPLDQGLCVLSSKEGRDVFGQRQVVTQVTELIRQLVC